MIQALPPELQENLAKILLAVLAFIIVWLLRHFLFKVARALIRRFTGDRNGSLDQTLFDAVNRPVSLLTLAIAIDISTRILSPDPAALTLAFRITRTLIIVAVLVVVYRVIGTVGQSRSRLYSFTGLTVDNALLPFVRTGLHLLLFAIGAIIIIQTWGYDVTGLVAGLGLGGLAFSLAAQETVSNVFGFSMIVSDRPFVVGEFIKTPDVEGIVERVGLRSTTVRQLNQAVVTIPNSKVAASPILNWSRLSKRWIDFSLGVNYGATPDQLEALMSDIRAMLAERPAVDETSIVVHFIEFGDSALQILVRAYVNKPAWLDFTQEREQVNLEIMRLVTKSGLSIAYPTRSLYIEKLPDMGNGLHNDLRMLNPDAQQEDPNAHRS